MLEYGSLVCLFVVSCESGLCGVRRLDRLVKYRKAVLLDV